MLQIRVHECTGVQLSYGLDMFIFTIKSGWEWWFYKFHFDLK